MSTSTDPTNGATVAEADDKVWQAWVRRAQTAMKAAWTLGDVAAEVTADGKYGDGHIARLAAEIGIGASTLRQYRQVAEAYATAERSARNTWSVHMLFAAQPDRATLVAGQKWTASEARAEIRRRKPESDEREATDAGEGIEPTGGATAKETVESTPAKLPTVADLRAIVAKLRTPNERNQRAAMADDLRGVIDALSALVASLNLSDDSQGKTDSVKVKTTVEKPAKASATPTLVRAAASAPSAKAA